MSGFIANNGTYNICTENEIAVILSRFNSDYIFDVMVDNIKQKYNSYNITSPNIVLSFENYFKQLKSIYSNPSDIATIEETRIQTYTQILNILAKEYNLEINYDIIQDYFSITYQLYDLLVANFKAYIVNFYTNFIIKEKNSIYDSLNLNEYKKNKDATTIYNRKLYKNTKLAIINANIDIVIQALAGYDISFNTLLNIVYNYDKNVVKFIESTAMPITDFYKNYFVNTIMNSNISTILLTNIRIEIQKQSIDTELNLTNLI